jgi:sRNA-binding protein
MTRTKRKEAVEAIAVLAERFPAAFFVFEQRRRPLKIGVFDEIVGAASDLDIRRLKLAVRLYTSAVGYQRSLVEGAPRIDLAGAQVGAVTAEEAAKAQERVKALLARRKARWLAAQANKLKPAPTPTPMPTPVKKGDGLSALRMAAQARRVARGDGKGSRAALNRSPRAMD